MRAANDVGSFGVQARVSPAVRPAQVIVYHAWEPFRLAGGYFHLQPRMAVGMPGPSDRGTRVEVEKREAAPPG